jgi:hypothetical protein
MQAVNDSNLFARHYDPFTQLQEKVGLGWLRRGVLRELDLRLSGYSNTYENRPLGTHLYAPTAGRESLQIR